MGILKIDDKLVSINEESLEGVDYKKVVSLISHRPCKLVFEREGYDNGGEVINCILK